jgi:hypothetical protein
MAGRAPTTGLMNGFGYDDGKVTEQGGERRQRLEI